MLLLDGANIFNIIKHCFFLTWLTFIEQHYKFFWNNVEKLWIYLHILNSKKKENKLRLPDYALWSKPKLQIKLSAQGRLFTQSSGTLQSYGHVIGLYVLIWALFKT